MKINKIYIERFGCYRRFAVEDLSQPVILFFGPNEAGKSTLHAFIRFILYGYEQRGENPYQPVEGGELGGYLEVEWEGRLVHLARRTPPRKGRLVVEVDGQKGDEVLLNSLLGHLPFHLFQAIFSFSHQELAQINVFSQKELHDYLYAAAMGGGAINLLQLEQEMAREREEFFKPRGTKPRINQLLASLKAKEKEMAALKEGMAKYRLLRQEREAGEKDLARLRQDRLKGEKELGELQLLKQGLEIKKERERLVEELAQLPPFMYLPYRQAIDHLKQREPLIRAMEKELVKLAEQERQAKREIEVTLHALGSPWRDEPHLAGRLTVAVKDRLRQAGEELREAEEQYERQVQELNEQKNRERILKAQYEKEQGELAKLQAASPLELGERSSYLPWFMAGGLLFFLLLPLFLDSVSPWLWLANGLVAAFLAAGWFYLRRLNINTSRRLARWEEEWQKARYAQDRYLQNLREEWEKAQRLVREGEGRLEQLSARRKQAKEKWQAALKELGWPQVSPAALPELFSRIHELNLGLAKAKELADEQRVRAEEMEEWKQGVAKLAGQLGRGEKKDGEPFSLDEAYRLLAKWTEELKEEEKRARHKEQLLNRLEELAKREEALTQALGWTEAQLAQELARENEEALTRQEEELRHRLERLQNEIEQKAGQRGSLELKMEQLKTEERLTEEVQAFVEEKEELNRLARHYGVLVLASHLLGQTRKIYEEQRQPTVLREAGEYFASMTGGRYTALIAPMGEKALYVKDGNGKRWPLHLLSQGTKEQLYLALRLAFIKVFDQQARLPLFLDDPLVNCDEERLYGILKGLTKISDTHQVFLFTCHPHILQAAKEVFRDKLKVVPLAQAPVLP